jgi:uncharacterized membrane protein SpoIIM required for sporulation
MVFEMILNPRRSERRPWEMLLVGLVYASLAVLIVDFVFSSDIVLAKFSGILVVTFTVMFSLPFFYYMIKIEENKDSQIDSSVGLLKEHSKAIHSLLWMFLGFIIAFSIWFIILGSTDNYRAQIETFCIINSPSNFEGCISQYGVKGSATGFAASASYLGGIFTNNIRVLIFTIIFSLIFGAGGIFVLAWNASVIGAAIVIFSDSNLSGVPMGMVRYLIHGIPEIAAYFIGTLAGGILGIAIVKKEYKNERFWNILHDTLLLIIIAIVILVIAAFVEVFVTPLLF